MSQFFPKGQFTSKGRLASPKYDFTKLLHLHLVLDTNPLMSSVRFYMKEKVHLWESNYKKRGLTWKYITCHLNIVLDGWWSLESKFCGTSGLAFQIMTLHLQLTSAGIPCSWDFWEVEPLRLALHITHFRIASQGSCVFSVKRKTLLQLLLNFNICQKKVVFFLQITKLKFAAKVWHLEFNVVRVHRKTCT